MNKLQALLLTAGIFFCLSLLPAADLKAQQVDVCNVYGTMYVEQNSAAADYFVYVEESEAFADLVVFKTDNRLFADRSGLWYMADKRNLANIRIFLVKSKAMADFTVYFTETESFAGCQ
jgi:hypothetical protein